MIYIHELPNWHHFYWNDPAVNPLACYRTLSALIKNDVVTKNTNHLGRSTSYALVK